MRTAHTPTAQPYPAAMTRTAARRAELAFLRGVEVHELPVDVAEPAEVREPDGDNGGPVTH